jgi:CubicO group peptidase (beta-lactamase class C family)
MQLVDEGLLDLDEAVVRYLPDFALADAAAASTLTVRQLLCHTAGFEGDIFTEYRQQRRLRRALRASCDL